VRRDQRHEETSCLSPQGARVEEVGDADQRLRQERRLGCPALSEPRRLVRDPARRRHRRGRHTARSRRNRSTEDARSRGALLGYGWTGHGPPSLRLRQNQVTISPDRMSGARLQQSSTPRLGPVRRLLQERQPVQTEGFRQHCNRRPTRGVAPLLQVRAPSRSWPQLVRQLLRRPSLPSRKSVQILLPRAYSISLKPPPVLGTSH
jgi:hypothetical protein